MTSEAPAQLPAQDYSLEKTIGDYVAVRNTASRDSECLMSGEAHDFFPGSNLPWSSQFLLNCLVLQVLFVVGKTISDLSSSQ